MKENPELGADQAGAARPARINVKMAVRHPELTRDWWRKTCRRVLRAASMEGIKLDHAEVNLFIVADDHMRRFNARYRKLNVPTDVLSFASSGDILVSLGRLKSQAQAHGHGLEREGAFLFAHGLLHLAGYDHATELQERVMLDVQSRILDRAGYSR